MDKSEVYREVDLITLLRALWRRSWVIALATVAAGAVCFAWAQFLIAPTYEASALLYVNNTQDASKPISNSELSAAQSLVDTYVVILNSRTTLDQVRAAARVTYTDRELQKMIQAQAVNSTEVFEVTVTSEDPQEAQKIANTIAQVLPSRISSVVEGSSVRVVGKVRLILLYKSPGAGAVFNDEIRIDFFRYCRRGRVVRVLLSVLEKTPPDFNRFALWQNRLRQRLYFPASVGKTPKRPAKMELYPHCAGRFISRQTRRATAAEAGFTGV